MSVLMVGAIPLWRTTPQFPTEVGPLVLELTLGLEQTRLEKGRLHDAALVEGVAASDSFLSDCLQVGVNGRKRVRRRLEPRELGVRGVTTCAAEKDRLRQESLTPESHKPFGIEVTWMDGPEAHRPV
jgi:hypothetical protein